MSWQRLTQSALISVTQQRLVKKLQEEVIYSFTD